MNNQTVFNNFSINETKLIIVAGGKGERLGLTDIPKPMVKIGGKSLLEHQIEVAKKYGIKDIFILSGYLANVIFDYFGDGQKFGVNITHLIEPYPLGNGGCLRSLKHLISKNEDFIVIYGDILLDIDFGELISFHKKSGSIATVLVYPNDHLSDSNLVDVDKEGNIKQTFLKPHDESKFYRNLAIRSIFAFSGRIFEYLSDKTPLDLDKGVIPELITKGEIVKAYRSGEYAKDIGTLDRLEMAEKDFQEGKPVKLIKKDKKRAIFLDRDGTINKYIPDLAKINDFELIDGVGEAVKKINQSGYLTVLVTNQPMVAKGFLTEEGLSEIHKKMDTLLAQKNAYLDGVYYCPHHPQQGFPGEVSFLKIDCDCRKPKPGMILKAAEDFNIDLKNSWIIGDSERDLIAGKNADCKTIYISNNLEKNQFADCVFADLFSAVNFILRGEDREKVVEGNRIPFGTITITPRAKNLVNDVLASGRVSQGKLVEEFEKKFAELIGVTEAVAVNTGTDADTLALAVMYDFGASREDEVIIPALSFVATGNAVLHAGFKPVFVDIDRKTLNINPDKIEKVITEKTRAIMPVHLMGKPAEMEKINQITKKYSLMVVEDAAEAHGAVYQGKNIGTLGDMAAYSLYLAHIVTTVEGGIITTNSERFAQILRSLRCHGRACKCKKCVLNTSSGYCARRFQYGDNMDIRFIFERIGYSSKMNELEAAIGLGSLEIYQEILGKRRYNLLRMIDGLKKYADFFYTISEGQDEKIGPHAFPIILKEGVSFTRNQFVSFLETNGIETRSLFLSMPTQCPGFKYLGYRLGDFPEAEYIGNNGLHIGVHQDITDEQIDYLFKVIDQFLIKAKNNEI